MRDSGVVSPAGVVIEANALANLTRGYSPPFVRIAVIAPEGLSTSERDGAMNPRMYPCGSQWSFLPCSFRALCFGDIDLVPLDSLSEAPSTADGFRYGFTRFGI